MCVCIYMNINMHICIRLHNIHMYADIFIVIFVYLLIIIFVCIHNLLQ